MSSDAHCGTHAGAAAELRALARTALDRLDPWVDRLGADVAGGSEGACAACPVCTLLTLLRGERPELAARIAEHASGLLAALRSALDEGGGPAPAPAQPPADAEPSRPRVQKISVVRP